MPDQNEPESRRGRFGLARPAFSCHRFKRTITINFNEEMAAELLRVLGVEIDADEVPVHLHEFHRQLHEALYQEPPAEGEKPVLLAPGRPRGPQVQIPEPWHRTPGPLVGRYRERP